jgi:hypothetical protein
MRQVWKFAPATATLFGTPINVSIKLAGPLAQRTLTSGDLALPATSSANALWCSGGRADDTSFKREKSSDPTE